MPTKTGMMLGLGETRDEVLQAMEEIAAQGTHILTLGQYMQPTREHLPIVRFVHPDEFAEFKQLGEQMGFKHVEAGPLVRSSYHAFEQEEAARQLAQALFASEERSTEKDSAVCLRLRCHSANARRPAGSSEVRWQALGLLL